MPIKCTSNGSNASLRQRKMHRSPLGGQGDHRAWHASLDREASRCVNWLPSRGFFTSIQMSNSPLFLDGNQNRLGWRGQCVLHFHSPQQMELSLFDFLPDEPEQPEPVKGKINIICGQAKKRARDLSRSTTSDLRKCEAWYEPLRELESRGSQTKVVGGLAGLHEARREHEGQFFTPNAVAAFMWSVVKMESGDLHHREKFTILDNSFGSGRLFQFAKPEQHQLYGIEKDEEVALAVQDVVRSAGFDSQLLTGSMEEFRMASNPEGAAADREGTVHENRPTVDRELGAYNRETESTPRHLGQSRKHGWILSEDHPSHYSDFNRRACWYNRRKSRCMA